MNIRKLFRSYTAAANFCTTHNIEDFSIQPAEGDLYVLNYDWTYTEPTDRLLFIAGAINGYLDSFMNNEQTEAIADLMKLVFDNYTRNEAAEIVLGIIRTFFDYYDKE